MDKYKYKQLDYFKENIEEHKANLNDSQSYNRCISLLAKTYLAEGNSAEMTVKLIIQWLKDRGAYRPSGLGKIRETVIKVQKTGDYCIRNCGSLRVYQSEWNKITQLESIELRRLAFGLLVYAKADRELVGLDIKCTDTSILTVARDSGIKSITGNEVLKLVAQLRKLGYVTNVRSNDSKVTCISYLEDSGEVAIVVDDLEQLNTYFNELEYGWIYYKCSCCSKRVKYNATKKRIKLPKRCPKCTKEYKKEYDKERFKSKNS